MSKTLAAEKIDILREECLNSLWKFAQTVEPHRVYGTVHRELYDFWQKQEVLEIDNTLALLPRDHQKSHMLAVRCCWEIYRHPAITIIYVSATSELAVRQLTDIKQIMEGKQFTLLSPNMLRPEEGKPHMKWGNYILSLRLTDDQGKAWAQSDEALWRLFPPNVWPMETTIRHEHEVELPAGLPPGEYQVWLRIVGAKDDQPLPASSGGVDVLLTPNLVVEPATEGTDEDALPPHTVSRARLGREIELLGYHLREGHHRPGHLLYLDLYWRVKKTPLADYRLRLQLVDEAGQAIGETVTTPTRAGYPPSRWQPGDVLHGNAELIDPPLAKAGFHQLRLSLIHPETGEPLPVRAGWWPFGRETLTLEEVLVVEWPMVTEIPPMETPLRADFGDPALIELHGYDLTATHDAADKRLTLTLFWRARSRMETSYTVFVHLADAGEQMAGQGDGVPDRGFRLTASWREGEVIADTHVIPIRPDASPGAYRLWVGFYDPATNQRLPIFVEGERQPDDRVLLSVIQITP